MAKIDEIFPCSGLRLLRWRGSGLDAAVGHELVARPLEFSVPRAHSWSYIPVRCSPTDRAGVGTPRRQTRPLPPAPGWGVTIWGGREKAGDREDVAPWPAPLAQGISFLLSCRISRRSGPGPQTQATAVDRVCRCGEGHGHRTIYCSRATRLRGEDAVPCGLASATTPRPCLVRQPPPCSPSGLVVPLSAAAGSRTLPSQRTRCRRHPINRASLRPSVR